ncbi:ABC transporter permease [Paenibacillus dendritiformis]|uniref:ABC transporter permease n=1 Tax=Paenibacillus dendritiformis TaxID=130049 RepID=UPI00387E17C5
MKRPVSGPWRLALYRWSTNAAYQWKALRSALDWTVWLYIAIPALLLGIKFYYDWWTLPLPAAWIALPREVWLLPFLLPVLSGTLHTWSEAGDVLFLRQKKAWWSRLAAFGLLTYTVRSVVMTGIIGVVAAPWLMKGYGLSAGELAALGAGIASLSILSACIRNRVQTEWHGWRRWGLGLLAGSVVIAAYCGLVYILSIHPFLPLGGALLLCILAAPFIRYRLHVTHAFERDVELESQARMRLTALLLSQSMEKPVRRKRKRGLLFPRSGYFMKRKHGGQVIGSLAVKSLLRSRNHFLFYLRFVGIGLFATVTCVNSLPGLYYFIVPVLCGVLSYWLSLYWREFIEGDVPSMFSFRSSHLQQAAAHMVQVLASVPGFLWALAGGLFIAPPLMALGMGLLGGLAAGVLGTVIVQMKGWKQKTKEEKQSHSGA